jgi:hypothetical protein
METGVLHAFPQEEFGVAQVMAESLVKRSIDALSLRHQNDGAAAGFECRVDIAEGAEIVLNVLDDIEAHDGIQLLFEPLEVGRIGRVHPFHFQCLAVGEAVFQAFEMFVVDVGGDVPLSPGNQLSREVAHPGADFQDPVADERCDRLRHPTVEVRGVGECVQDRLVGVRVDVGGEGVAQNHPERLEGVLQADLLSLRVGPAVVADRRFVDLGLSLGELDGDFRLEAEAVRADRDAFQQRRAEGLVTGLHVRQVHVGDDVAHGGQHPVCEGVPVVEHPAFARGEKARSEDGIGAPVKQRSEHFRILARIVLEVRILDDGKVPIRRCDCPPQGRSLAAVPFGPQQTDFSRIQIGHLLHYLNGPVF